MGDAFSRFSCQYRIFGIVSQTLPVSEEFSEIKCRYFTSKKELPPLFSPGELLQMVVSSYIGGDSLYAVAQLRVVTEFLTFHVPLALRPV